MPNGQYVKFFESFSPVDPSLVIATLEKGLEIERLDLETYKALHDVDKCKEIRERISDTQVFLSILYLRQFNRRS